MPWSWRCAWSPAAAPARAGGPGSAAAGGRDLPLASWSSAGAAAPSAGSGTTIVLCNRVGARAATELRNVEADARRFRLRVFVLGVVVLLAFLLIVARLLVLQVERHDDLAEQAESNRTAIVPIVLTAA